MGRATDGSAVLIGDEQGNPLPVGEIARVWVRGADYWPSFEYLNQGTPHSPVEGMLWVGDLGYLDADCFLYLTGRDAEVVIRGGVNIYPAEIENAIAVLDGVEDVAVFGLPDPGTSASSWPHTSFPGPARTSPRTRSAMRFPASSRTTRCPPTSRSCTHCPATTAARSTSSRSETVTPQRYPSSPVPGCSDIRRRRGGPGHTADSQSRLR